MTTSLILGEQYKKPLHSVCCSNLFSLNFFIIVHCSQKKPVVKSKQNYDTLSCEKPLNDAVWWIGESRQTSLQVCVPVMILVNVSLALVSIKQKIHVACRIHSISIHHALHKLITTYFKPFPWWTTPMWTNRIFSCFHDQHKRYEPMNLLIVFLFSNALL